ncbi:competence protein ComK [Mycoplasmatota bacterium]|nr:competence protein ComK [Mycoplasmatota bacterium]
MIDYIKVVDYKIHVIENQKTKIYDEAFTKYFNRLLNKYLVNLSSRERLTKRRYGFENKVPLILDDNHIFLCIKSYRLYEAFYINYFQIIDWKKINKGVVVTFSENHCLYLESYISFIKQIKKVDHILNN